MQRIVCQYSLACIGALSLDDETLGHGLHKRPFFLRFVESFDVFLHKRALLLSHAEAMRLAAVVTARKSSAVRAFTHVSNGCAVLS